MHPVHDALKKADLLLSKGDPSGAEALARRAIAKFPNDPSLNFLLAVALWFQQKTQQCDFYIRKAVLLAPHVSKHQNLLGQVCMRTGRRDEAITHCRRACELDPNDSTAWNALGAMHMLLEQAEEAFEPLRRAYTLDPTDMTAACNLAGCLGDIGQAENGCEVLARALEAAPNDFAVLTSFAGAVHYPGVIDVARKFAIQTRLGAVLDGAPKGIELRTRRAGPRSGPLRVGILSADFRTHSCAFFLAPILRHLPAEGFELSCYDSTHHPDQTTSVLLRSLCPRWTRIAEMNDEQTARAVARDEIDIIIETGGHTSGSRASVLAWRPAPMSVTYLGYPSTTGMRTIDFRLVDSVTDPTGSERWCTEQLLRIPDGFLCYDPITTPPPSRPPRTDRVAPVRFGSFNATKKVCRRCVELWSRLLREVPDSTLVLKGHAVPGGHGDRALREGFASQGVDPSRITILGRTKEVRDHLMLYESVDIAIDTFPYHGTTTTIEALMMGVPVVTLAGEEHVSRVGASILHGVNLDDLVAEDDEAFVRICATLASDGARLTSLHATLRDTLDRSPMRDAPGFARRLGATLREGWAMLARQ